jgi:hypothetical protein
VIVGQSALIAGLSRGLRMVMGIGTGMLMSNMRPMFVVAS